MAIPRLLEELGFIAQLGDNPRVDDGMTTPEFKAEFDRAAKVLQKFINETVIPAIEALNAGAVVMSDTKPAIYPAFWIDTSADVYELKYVDYAGTTRPVLPKTSVAAIEGLSDTIEGIQTAIDEDIKTPLKAVTIDLPVEGWTATVPYTQTVTVEGMTAAWTPGYFVAIPGEDVEQNILVKDDLACINAITSLDGALTVICYETKPTVAMSIRISGVLV